MRASRSRWGGKIVELVVKTDEMLEKRPGLGWGKKEGLLITSFLKMSSAFQGQWEHQPGAFSQPKVSSGWSSDFPTWLPSELAPLALGIQSKVSGMVIKSLSHLGSEPSPSIVIHYFPSHCSC